jgi:6-phosphogluconolactonase
MEVYPDPSGVARAVAEVVVETANRAVDRSGRFAIALSGGATPRRLYRLLAAPGEAERIPWEAVHVYWGDERCVPPVDPESDYLMAKETLLDHVPIPEGRVHRIRGEEDPAAAATAYERLLRRAFGVSHGSPREATGARFDLVLLGLGEDGHTASIFPGTPAVHESERWVVAVDAGVSPRRRITLTPPLLNAAAHKVFLVTGAAKAQVLARVLEGPFEPDILPAQVIEGADWFVDAAAASMLAS